MVGWKTYLAVIGFVLLAIYSFINGDTNQAVTYLLSALAILGIGHKVDKARKELKQ